MRLAATICIYIAVTALFTMLFAMMYACPASANGCIRPYTQGLEVIAPYTITLALIAGLLHSGITLFNKSS